MTLAIVVPCYDEQQALPITVPRLVALLQSMVADGSVTPDSFILFVDDGSRDSTWKIIADFHDLYPCVHGLRLAANVGHQNAIIAGMFAAVAPLADASYSLATTPSSLKAAASPIAAAASPLPVVDAVITIDADLQDPLECIPRMVADFKGGSEVVYGVRSSRETDSFFKRCSAESFYHLQSGLGLKTIFNHSDFRLLSRRVVLELMNYEERNMYLRGVIPMMGFTSSIVEEERCRRVAGKTKYSLRRMLSLAFDGISSFSIKPMYLILALGGVSILIALITAIYVIISLCYGNVVAGWASLMLSVWLVGGMVMVSVGLVGLYVGKVYLETKHRPRYHITSHLH